MADVRGNELWAWQEQEANGSWGIIAALVPGINSVAPLVLRSYHEIQKLTPIARQHAESSGRQVRLAKFTLAETVTRVDW
jgi:hypothetical protein